jgi:threonine/homoserine/homoserine lactone efflux protein
MLWLAWKIASADPDPEAPEGARGGRPLSFLQGAAFQWVNPKAWVIALGALATYIPATDGALLGQALLLAAIFVLVTFPSVALWTLVGVGAARLLRTRRALRLFNLAMAALLVASLLPLLAGG